MKVKQFTRWSFKVHSWLGLLLGLLYLFFGLSGSLLVFQKETDGCFNPEIHHVHPGAQRLPLDVLYRNVVKAHPAIRQIVVHDLPEDEMDSYEFMLYTYQQGVSDNYLYSVIVNPYTGKVIREGNFRSMGASFFRWLYSAHYCLQVDKPGRLITAVIAILFFVNLITGVIIYRKQILKVLTFQVRFGFAKRHRAISSLHRIVGVWTLVLNFILFFTGFWMNKSLFLPKEWALIPDPQHTVLITGNVDTILSKAFAVNGFTPVAVKIGVDAERDVVVSGQFAATANPLYTGKGSDVYFDAHTNALKQIVRIEDKSFSDRFYWAMKQLHVGHFNSLLLRWLYVLAGVAPGLLALSGFYLYYKRTRKKRI